MKRYSQPTKAAQYWYDAEAVRQGLAAASVSGVWRRNVEAQADLIAPMAGEDKRHHEGRGRYATHRQAKGYHPATRV